MKRSAHLLFPLALALALVSTAGAIPALPPGHAPGPGTPHHRSDPSGPQVSPQTGWLTLGQAPYPSLLRVPAACHVRACPLVVVAHPRAQSAERLRDSAGVSVLSMHLLDAGFVVLLGGDAGPATWGSPAALARVAHDHTEATRHFFWNGHTYALGLSMGGLLALRSALPGSPYPVLGVALIDGWVNLDAAWRTGGARQAEIRAAYGLDPLPPRLDPLQQLAHQPPLPLLTVSSPDDQVVSQTENAERLRPYAEPGLSGHWTVSGPHLGGNRFTPEVARHLTDFFGRIEARTPPQYGF